jgi:hypothetical protein
MAVYIAEDECVAEGEYMAEGIFMGDGGNKGSFSL